MSSNPPHYAPDPASASGSNRVPIPRLQRHPVAPSSQARRRVARACKPCRTHKVKCSGDQPECKHCEATGRECFYIMPRKDRLKIVTERCAQMSTYLKNLRHAASEQDAAKIGELLESVEEDVSDMPQAQTPTSAGPDGEEPPGEPRGSIGDGTTVPQAFNVEPLDLWEFDLQQSGRSRETGLVGATSEVQWLHALLEADQRDSDSMLGHQPSYTASNSDQVSLKTFWLDTANLDYAVDPYHMPTAETAKRLLDHYMDKVHISFPILSPKLFEDNFKRCFGGIEAGIPPRLSPRWQATLNLVFAIGSRYSYLTGANQGQGENDYSVYEARARKFGWNEITLSQRPDLPQVQVAGLLAFYYLSTGQVNQAWVIAGMAIRFAQALGLHVRNDDPTLSGPKREMLTRIWWSLYALDRQLSVITGRPSVVISSTTSVALPMPESEEQIEMANVNSRRSGAPTRVSAMPEPAYMGPQAMSGVEVPHGSIAATRENVNSGSYFRAVIQMTSITQVILSSVYPAGPQRSQVELQQSISHLGQQLDQWLASLPDQFNFQKLGSSGPHTATLRPRFLLGFQYYGARILLTRPSFGRMGDNSRDERPSAASPIFLQGVALLCVEAAKALLDLLPDLPDARFLYAYAPWWSCVHHLMQAIASLLLALSSPLFDFQTQAVLAGYATKAIRWLRSMHDVLAYRAYLVAMHAFQIVAGKLSIDTTDLWNEHAMAYPHMDPMVVAGAAVSQMGFPSWFTDSLPISLEGHYDVHMAMPLAQSSVSPSSSSEPLAASFDNPMHPMGGPWDETFYRFN